MRLTPAWRGALALAIPWALAVAWAISRGNEHGHVPEYLSETLPYETDVVIEVSALMAAESLLLFWILFRGRMRVGPIRTLAALGTCLAMLMVSAALITDRPAAWYADTLWGMVMTFAMFVLLVEQGLVAFVRGFRR